MSFDRRPRLLRVVGVTVALLCAVGTTSAANPALSNLLTLDCSGGLHLLVDTPLETNINLSALKTVWDTAADGIVARAQAAWYVPRHR